MQGSQPVLDVQRICKTYGSHRALNDVSFTVGPGDVAAIIGPNGAGKSTALHVITHLIQATSGRTLVVGRDVAVPSTLKWIGFAPDDLPMPQYLTGLEYLHMHAVMRGEPGSLDDGLTIAVAFQLGDSLSKTILEFSHGMKRKLQIAAAVMGKPALLILDEPYRGLDPEAVATLRYLISQMASSGTGVLMATHDLALAEREATTVHVLSGGALLASGSPAVIKGEYGVNSLEDAFLLMTGLMQAQAQRQDSLAEIFR